MSKPGEIAETSILDVEEGDIIRVTGCSWTGDVRVTSVIPDGKHSVTIETEPVR